MSISKYDIVHHNISAMLEEHCNGNCDWILENRPNVTQGKVHFKLLSQLIAILMHYPCTVSLPD